MRTRIARVLTSAGLLCASCDADSDSRLPSQRADLQVSALSHAPCSASAGQQISVNDRVHNDGRRPAAAFRLGIYLSLDSLIDAQDTLLGQRTVTGLPAGASSSATTPLTIPASLAPGTYYLGAIADDLEQVAEGDEGNNRRRSSSCSPAGSLQVDASADLLLSSVTHDPCSVESGGQITVDDTVQNLGEGASGGFRVGYYLSTDSSIDTGDVLLGDRSVVSLAQGSSSAGTTPLTIPASTAAGTYYVGAIADDLDEVEESDEGNNAALSSSCFPRGALEVTGAPLRGGGLAQGGLAAPAAPGRTATVAPERRSRASSLHRAPADCALAAGSILIHVHVVVQDGALLFAQVRAGAVQLWMRVEVVRAQPIHVFLSVAVTAGRTTALEWKVGSVRRR
ncbi:MAG: hypothetical protein EYC70_01495 [Planctomycetota bacterium]|nr:MAG: hypothetical protein EYC70_01495 [Planctomycetota bacterium]